MTWTVIWRQGGPMDCSWHRSLHNHDTYASAVAMRDEIKNMGYWAAVWKTEALDSVGLPVGWTHDLVDWDDDEIVLGCYSTQHRPARTPANKETTQ